MKTFEIAVLPGDGIGIEVMRAALKVLEVVDKGFQSVALNYKEHPAGAGEYLRNGNPLPEETFVACERADAVLLGAMGLPSVRWEDGREMTPQIDIRERLDLYCGLRPIELFHESDTPLKGYQPGGFDFVIIRENTEGLFSARLSKESCDGESVTDLMRITRKGTERVCRSAFNLAMKRNKRVTLVDKANVLPSMVFMRSIFDEVGKAYPEVTREYVYVDAASLFMVKKPECFDVIVTENMFGDILSDLAAGIVGGMGMAPSADIGDKCAVFQPSHGTAPDIAGKDLANPVAMILSAALMLDWLKHPELVEGAATIRRAVQSVLQDPACRTSDMGGQMSTSELTERILNACQN